METAKSVREDFLQQNAFRDDDQFTSLAKQDRLLATILLFHTKAVEAVKAGASMSAVLAAPVRERIARAKYLTEDAAPAEFYSIAAEIETQLAAAGSVREGGAR